MVEYAMFVYALCVSRASAILFNSSTGAVTEHLYSAKDTYSKTQPYVENLGLPAADGIRAHNLLIDNLCLIIGLHRSLQILKVLNFRQWNHEVTLSGNSLMIIALHKYLLPNIHSLYCENERQIIL